jgi:putative ABC transport system substrate-binding protein
MRRRDFITLLGVAATAWPLAARAQRAGQPVIGFLYAGSSDSGTLQVPAFRKGLSETGFVEGRNLAIEFRYAQNDPRLLAEIATDLARRKVAVIFAFGSTAAPLAAKAATTTIPIVFLAGADPVQTGLVASLNRPGGNITGVITLSGQLGAKRLGLLHELLPAATRFAALVNQTNPGFEVMVKDAQAAAAAIGREINMLAVSNSRDIDLAFASLANRRTDAVVVTPDTLFGSRRTHLVTLAMFYRVPAIFPFREYAEIGGLMSYGASALDQTRQGGILVGRVLKGERPADLPVMRASKFEFILNLQTARILGIEVPPTLLAIADEVIE